MGEIPKKEIEGCLGYMVLVIASIICVPLAALIACIALLCLGLYTTAFKVFIGFLVVYLLIGLAWKIHFNKIKRKR